MPFDALEMSLTVREHLAPVETKVRQRRKSLADEIGRAAESIARNVSEARQRAGLDRADLFRRAAGSAGPPAERRLAPAPTLGGGRAKSAASAARWSRAAPMSSRARWGVRWVVRSRRGAPVALALRR